MKIKTCGMNLTVPKSSNSLAHFPFQIKIIKDVSLKYHIFPSTSIYKPPVRTLLKGIILTFLQESNNLN